MTTNVRVFFEKQEWPLFLVGGVLLVLAVWLIIEAALAAQRFRKAKKVIDSLNVFPED